MRLTPEERSALYAENVGGKRNQAIFDLLETCNALEQDRAADLTRLARAQGIREAAAAICQHCDTGEESLEYQGIWKHKIGGYIQHCYAHGILAKLDRDAQEALAASQQELAAINTVLQIMLKGKQGAALNAIVEDYPELWARVAEHDRQVLLNHTIEARRLLKFLRWWFLPPNVDTLPFWCGSWKLYLFYMRIGVTAIPLGVLYALWKLGKH